MRSFIPSNFRTKSKPNEQDFRYKSIMKQPWLGMPPDSNRVKIRPGPDIRHVFQYGFLPSFDPGCPFRDWNQPTDQLKMTDQSKDLISRKAEQRGRSSNAFGELRMAGPANKNRVIAFIKWEKYGGGLDVY